MTRKARVRAVAASVMRKPKPEYFEERMNDAYLNKDWKKFKYYRDRLAALGVKPKTVFDLGDALDGM